MKKKRKQVSYYDPITLENIYKMWLIIKSTCKNKKEVYYFSLNLNTNLYSIYKDLLNKTYTPNKYRPFMIFEPKARLVMSQSIRDKIVNHFVTNYYLIPYLENKLIDSNVATRKNKGSSYAMKLLKSYFNKIIINEHPSEIYCLKLDISKYFYTIDHNKLLNMLNRYIKDKDILNLIKIIISETNNTYINKYISKYNNYYNTDIPLYIKDKGLSIGAMTSQFLAIFYLNELDHYIKEYIHSKYYIRYMDDFIILDTNKNKLYKIWQLIQDRIKILDLDINKKSNIYRCSIGFIFLGFKYRLINSKLHINFSKNTYNKIINNIRYLKINNSIKYHKSIASYYGYFKIIYNMGKVNFKMNCLDLYNSYKNKYTNNLVIIKDGALYRSYFDDAMILSYIFKFKYSNESIMFNSFNYDEVTNKLDSIGIGYVIVTKERELLNKCIDTVTYNIYKRKANKLFLQDNNRNSLFNRISKLLDKDDNYFNIINEYIDMLESK